MAYNKIDRIVGGGNRGTVPPEANEKKKRKRNSLYRVQKSMKLAWDRTSRKMVYHLVWIRFVYASKWRIENENEHNAEQYHRTV